jgi:hypothetical protein
MPSFVLQLDMPTPLQRWDHGGWSTKFPYSLVLEEFVGTPVQTANTQSGSIVARVSGTLLATWKLQTDDVLRIMAYLVRSRIAERISTGGSISSDDSVDLTSYTIPGGKCPFDLDNLEQLPGRAVAVSVSRPIGFTPGVA